MDNLKIVGAPLPDMPWEDRPEGSKEVLWRYSKNPVIPRDISRHRTVCSTVLLSLSKVVMPVCSVATIRIAGCVCT